MRRFSLLLFSFLLSLAAQAQAGTWVPVEGPYGTGVIKALVVEADGTVLAATGGGVYALAGNDRWRLANDGIIVRDARALLARPDGRTFVGTYGGGVLSRTTPETRWTPTALQNVFITTLAEGPDGTLYAGSIDRLYVSTDDGASWQAAAFVDGDEAPIDAIAATATYLFVATPRGIFRSTDRGATWMSTNAGLQHLQVTALAADSNGDLIAGTSPWASGCTVYRSRNAGALWSCIEPPSPPLQVRAAAFAPDGTLYVGGVGAVFRSLDSGSTWTTMAVAPTNIQAFALDGDAVYAGTAGRGVFQGSFPSTDWTPLSDGLSGRINDVHIDGPTLYVATEGGVFKSDTVTGLWTRLDRGLTSFGVEAIAQDPDGNVLVGTVGGVYRLDAASETWQHLGPTRTTRIRDLVVAPDGTLYGSYYAGVYRLQQRTWTPLALTADGIQRNVGALCIGPDGTLYAGAQWDSFRLRVGGQPWSLLRYSNGNPFTAQTFAVADDGSLYVGTKFLGLIRSADGGVTWTSLAGGLTGREDIRAVAFAPDGTPYIGTFGSGVYRYDAQYQRWQSISEGLTDLRIQTLDFAADGTLFVGTYGGGLFRSADTGTSSEDAPELPAQFVFGGNHPNPFSMTTTILFDLSEPATIDLDVFDLLGRRVYRERNKRFGAGSDHRLTIDASALPTGLYLYRLTAAAATGTTSRSATMLVVR